MLHELLENLLKSELIDESWQKETKHLLQQAEHYLKTDYRIHVKKFPRCADHCITFALSDPNNKKFSSQNCQDIKNHEHEHDMQCERCLYFPEVVNRIKNILDESSTAATENDEINDKILEYKEIIENCEKRILNLKMHILRSVFCDMEKSYMIETLKEGEAFSTMDYAQKFIPRKSNQQQRDYYGLKGLSWHVFHIFAIVNGKLVQHSVVYLMGYEKQTAKTVITMSRDLLLKLKSWGIDVVTFRSDNASNYHNIDLMVNLFAMSLNMGIRIKRYSFSEAQNGKSWSDMETSLYKRKMREALDAGKDIESPDAMYDAIHFGMQPLCAKSVVVAKVNGKDILSKKPLKGITKLSDFVFDYEKKKIRYWQHFNIGNGETLAIEDYKDLVLDAELNITRVTTDDSDAPNFWRSSYVASETVNEDTADVAEEFEENVEIDPEDDYVNPPSTAIFFCPVCQESFKTYGYLTRHLRIGKHLLVAESCTAQDYTLNTYRQCLETATTSPCLPRVTRAIE